MNKQPNILFLFSDQQRLDTLGCYGNAVCRTPHIDRLAAEGVLFTQAYTPTSICTPARGSILTGLMPHRHRLLANFERNVGYLTELPDDLVPYSAYLRQAGYNTGSFGKWHVGQERGPEEYAFDGPHFPGWAPPVQHPEYQAYLQEKGLPPFEVRDLVRGRFPNGQPANVIAGLYDGPPEGLFDSFITERTIRQMRAYAAEDKPFFLACHWFGPHLPYFLPPEVFSRYAPQDIPLPPTMADTLEGKPQVQRRYAAHWAFDSFTPDDWRRIIAAYWGYVSLLDEQVGRLLAALRELGLADDTVVVYGSDHGAFAGSHRMQDKGPAMYDDTYHVPLIMRLPGGRRADEERFVNLVDLPATFLDLAGLPSRALRRAQPRPAAQQGHRLRRPRHRRVPRPSALPAAHDPHGYAQAGRQPADIDELYDLVDDPLEMVNRIDDPAYSRGEREQPGRLAGNLRRR